MFKVLKYLVFISLLLMSGCKFKHVFYRDMHITVPIYKDEGNVIRGKEMSKEELKEHEKFFKDLRKEK